jgi:CTP synthase
MQLAVVEFARHVVGWSDAHTTEIEKNSENPVIDVMPEQIAHLQTANYGGSMRLGSYPALLKKGSIAREVYKTDIVRERHRHRYEVNPHFVNELERHGLFFSGVSPDGHLMELMELPRRVHPYFVGTQAHPEFTSTPLHPGPLFLGFLGAALAHSKRKR